MSHANVAFSHILCFGVCMWVLGLYKLEVLGALIGFSLWIVAKLLCSCLSVLDANIELHAMDEKMFNDFLLGGESGFHM